MKIDETRSALLAQNLLGWFDAHARELPWREVDDPYATWVSEIMLQQTQVVTVIDYFERWMLTFPDVLSLAKADLDDVLSLWQGLGYYRRARYLHKGAKMVVEEFDGRLPETAKELEKIPGIGPYTAGAIASIAHGESAPVVDGNVTRVLARLFALEIQPKERSDQKLIWSIAGQLVPDERPGDFNQSLMELGATVCTPANPACLVCPVREVCEGFASGEPTAFPLVARRAKVRKAEATCGIVTRRDGAEVLIEQRPETGLLAGLWQFPMLDDGSTEELEEKLRSAGLEISDGASIGVVSHLFSHIDMTVRIVRYRLDDGGEGVGPGRWIRWAELDDVAFSTLMRKVENLVREHIG